jgi:hypothetical protein
MTKTIMPNDMVQHVWAAQSQPNARTSNGNQSFEGTTLFSYSTPIANIVEGINGQKVALVTCHSYSVTTTVKHMPGHRALSHMPYFHVPCLGVGWLGRHHETGYGMTPEKHQANLDHLVAGYVASRDGMARYKSMPYDAQGALQRHADEATGYAMAFGLPVPAFDPASDATALVSAIAARIAASSTPEAIAKREAANAKRKARQAAKEAEEYRLASLAWVDGGARRPYGGPVLLRVFTSGRDGAKHLETSLGATVPLEHAIKVFRFVKLCREEGREWHRNGHTLRVGHFQVDHVLPNGDFHAGCHFIQWPETERLAGLLGLLDAVPSDDGLEASQHAA